MLVYVDSISTAEQSGSSDYYPLFDAIVTSMVLNRNLST